MNHELKIKDVSIKTNYILNLPYNPSLNQRAKSLRKAGNYAEVVFWKQVRNKEFWKIDFDRQRIIGNYIVDFYVKSLGLVIEIDGESHNENENYDKIRDDFMIDIGIRVFRISKLRILHDLDNVIRELEDFIIKEYSN